MLWLMLATAGPVYLDCKVPEGQKPFDVTFTLDEAAGRATINIPSSGVTYVQPAAFTVDKVVVAEAHSTWVLDRVSLVARRSYDFGEQPNVDIGKCEVKPAPAKRAF